MKNRQLTQQQIRAYAHYLQMEEKSGATMEKYLRDIQAFACWLDGRDISKELTSEWKGHLTPGRCPLQNNGYGHHRVGHRLSFAILGFPR